MKLYINTSDNKNTVVGLDGDRLEKRTGLYESQQLLSLINQILKKHQKKLHDITKIRVETGPGSFTGLKVGVSVANALAWALKIPINGKKVGQLVEPKYEYDETASDTLKSVQKVFQKAKITEDELQKAGQDLRRKLSRGTTYPF